MASLKQLDATLETVEEDLKDLLNEVGKAQDTNDPAVKSKVIKKVQERMVAMAKDMPFPVVHFN